MNIFLLSVGMWWVCVRVVGLCSGGGFVFESCGVAWVCVRVVRGSVGLCSSRVN